MQNMDASIDRRVLDTLLQNLDGDADSLAELIATYLEDAPRQVEALQQAISSGTSGTVERIAHTLKGTSSAFGATILCQTCQKLERSSAAGDLNGAVVSLQEIKAELPRVHSFLSAYVKAR